MSETTTVEPPVEPAPLQRRASDRMPQTFPPSLSPRYTSPAASRRSFSFMQVAVLIGIVGFVMGACLLFVALRTPAPAPAVSAPAVEAAPSNHVDFVTEPQASAPAAVTTPSENSVEVSPGVPKPASEIPHPVKQRHVAAASHTVSPAPAVPEASAPPVPVRSIAILEPPLIDTVRNLGTSVHIAWKSLGDGVTYKVYAMPDVHQRSFEFRFNMYGTDLKWILNENKAWRYVAITAVNKNGDETALSNIVDTKAPVPLTPAAPPPVFAPPVIDTVENLGPYVHMTWKPLGAGVTYKVYAMPNVHKPNFKFRFNMYGTDLKWFLSDNAEWRYVAVTAVDKSGDESPLSNIVDTTPGLPKPDF